MLSAGQIKAFGETGRLELPAAFAPEEIGWLREEAIAAALRASPPQERGATGIILPDVHRREPSFRKLAQHPRIVHSARDLLGGDIGIAGTALCFGTRAPLPPEADLTALVLLDWETERGAALRIGTLALARGASPSLYPLYSGLRLATWFIGLGATTIPEVAPRHTPVRPESDECLWPPVYVMAG